MGLIFVPGDSGNLVYIIFSLFLCCHQLWRFWLSWLWQTVGCNNPRPSINKFLGILCKIRSVQQEVTQQPHWSSLSLFLGHSHIQKWDLKSQQHAISSWTGSKNTQWCNPSHWASSYESMISKIQHTYVGILQTGEQKWWLSATSIGSKMTKEREGMIMWKESSLQQCGEC